MRIFCSLLMYQDQPFIIDHKKGDHKVREGVIRRKAVAAPDAKAVEQSRGDWGGRKPVELEEVGVAEAAGYYGRAAGH